MALQALKNRENSTKKTEKRYRKNAVIVRFSDDEYKKLLAMMEQIGAVQKASFVRDLVLKTKLPKPKNKINERYINQLAWIGNNLNQSAKALNIIKKQDQKRADDYNLASIALALDNIQKEFVVLREIIEQDLANDS